MDFEAGFWAGYEASVRGFSWLAADVVKARCEWAGVPCVEMADCQCWDTLTISGPRGMTSEEFLVGELTRRAVVYADSQIAHLKKNGYDHISVASAPDDGVRDTGAKSTNVRIRAECRFSMPAGHSKSTQGSGTTLIHRLKSALGS
jgi:hypothetical protein